ncbi:hypothetical protein [Mumia zhuanghuii]|jgi:hypothetical protein|uniref:hypothetical protein n=1 Tax=Mumia zhuanghuii TaxID=2585211 RepID=UPI00129C16EB|nr:hypothetical protein [Mumia zhuanghuii]
MRQKINDAVSVEEAAATYEERSRRTQRITGFVVAAGSLVLAAVVAIGISGLEPLG